MQLIDVKNHLKKHGWSQEQAARQLKVSFSYFNRVLNGHLKSRRLVAKILCLGPNPNPSKAMLQASA